MTDDIEEALIENVAAAIYRKFEDRPDYAKAQMNVVLARELAVAAIEEFRQTCREQFADTIPIVDMKDLGDKGCGPDHAPAAGSGIVPGDRP